jgi:hypothetical protein
MSHLSALYPDCPKCGLSKGIAQARVGPSNPEGMHDVESYVLACGHVDPTPDAQLSKRVVAMLRLQSPDLIEVVR